MKNLTDPDPQKNLFNLATKLAELQEQHRLTQSKIHEAEKRSAVLMRERDQVLLENGRITAGKTKLESLCRELHRHNQQIRVKKKLSINFSFIKDFLFQDECLQRQQDDETKRRELATKFQVFILFYFFSLSSNFFLRQQSMKLLHNYQIIVKNLQHYVKKMFNYPNN